MQAIILAGGLGTRLRSVVSDVPKPMAMINDKPFLYYLLNTLNNQGFNKVILAVGYKKEVIEDYFKNQFKNIKIVYSVEDQPLGTGGAIKKALDYVDESYAYIFNGDTFFDIDFSKFKTSKDIAIACKYLENFDRYGKVEITDGIITSFYEKQSNQSGYINGGVYCIKKDIFKNYNFSEKFSFEKDFLEPYITKLSIEAYCSNSYFIDIGIPEDYYKAQEDFKNE